MTQKPHVDTQENVCVNIRGSQTLARAPTTTVRGWVSKTRSVGGVKGAGSPEPALGQRMGLEGAMLCEGSRVLPPEPGPLVAMCVSWAWAVAAAARVPAGRTTAGLHTLQGNFSACELRLS